LRHKEKEKKGFLPGFFFLCSEKTGFLEGWWVRGSLGRSYTPNPPYGKYGCRFCVSGGIRA
jgi:hypothetical protein